MGLSRAVGIISNFIIVGLIIAALFGFVDWATIGITVAILFSTSFAIGLIEGRIKRKSEEVDLYYSDKIFNALTEKYKEEDNSKSK